MSHLKLIFVPEKIIFCSNNFIFCPNSFIFVRIVQNNIFNSTMSFLPWHDDLDLYLLFCPKIPFSVPNHRDLIHIPLALHNSHTCRLLISFSIPDYSYELFPKKNYFLFLKILFFWHKLIFCPKKFIYCPKTFTNIFNDPIVPSSHDEIVDFIFHSKCFIFHSKYFISHPKYFIFLS